MDLSIIIPLYNTAQYIEKCVLSAVNQDIEHDRFEVIVVNDGSTDSSESVAEALAKRYTNVHLHTKPNGGLSDARNYGMQRAKGKYIMFLDSDDSYTPNLFSMIIENMESLNLDVLSMNYMAIDEQGAKVDINCPQWDRPKPSGVVTGKEFVMCDSYIIMVPLYCYRLDYMRRNNLSFMNITHEDEEFTPRALSLASAVKYTDIISYYYLQRGNSITHNIKPQLLFDTITAAASLMKFANKHFKNDRNLYSYFRKHIGRLVVETIKRSINNNMNIEKELIKQGRKQGVMPVFNHKKSSRIFLLNHFPSLYIKRYKNHKS